MNSVINSFEFLKEAIFTHVLRSHGAGQPHFLDKEVRTSLLQAICNNTIKLVIVKSIIFNIAHAMKKWEGHLHSLFTENYSREKWNVLHLHPHTRDKNNLA